jgi:hypothetical protein
LLDREVPDQAGDAVDDRVQRDEAGHIGQDRRLRQRLEQQPLDRDAAGERKYQRDQERSPIGHAPLHQLPANKGREHRHFALGEIEMIDGLVDHDHRERHAGINRAGGDAGQNLIGKKLHGRAPQ